LTARWPARQVCPTDPGLPDAVKSMPTPNAELRGNRIRRVLGRTTILTAIGVGVGVGVGE